MLGLTDFALLKFKYSTYSHDVSGYSDKSYFVNETLFSTVPDEYAVIYGGREFKVAQGNINSTSSNWTQLGQPPVLPTRIDSVEKTTGSFTSQLFSQVPTSYGIPSPGLYGVGAVSVAKIPSSDGRLLPTEKAIIAGGVSVYDVSTGAQTFTKTVFQYRPSNMAYWYDGEEFYYEGTPFNVMPSLNEFRFNPLVDEFLYKTDPNSVSTWRNAYIVACGGSASFEVLKSGRIYSTTLGRENDAGDGSTSWTLTTMSSPHVSGAMCVSPDSTKLLFFGGTAGEGVEAYYLQPSVSVSSTVGMIHPTSRWNFASAVDKTGRFWVAGGYAAGGTGTLRNDVWAFDFVTNEWTNMPNLPVAIAGGKLVFSSLSGSDEVFIIGGHDSSPNAVNGYVMKYLDGSPSWTAMSSVMLSQRVSDHKAVSLGPVSGTSLYGLTSANSGSLIVTGGKRFRTDSPSVMIPNSQAITEIVKKSSSINIASSFGLTGLSTYNATVYPWFDYTWMVVTVTSSDKIFPIASLVISGWSGSDGSGSSDLINSTTASVYSPTGMFALDRYSDYGASFYVPAGSVKNNTRVYMKPVTSSLAYLTSSNKIDNIPSQLISISPSNIDVQASATALPPASSVTGTGNWMNYLSGVYFGNSSVYGNNVYFTSSFSTGSDYYHKFRLPTTSSILANGQEVFLRSNTLHDMYIKENDGGTAGSFRSYYKRGQNTTPLKWLSGQASNSENPNSSKYLWFKFNEPSSSANVSESIGSYTLSNTASWASGTEGAYYQQFRSDLLSGSRLLRAGKSRAANPSANLPLTNYTQSAAGPIPLRDTLGSGSYALEFWYYSPASSSIQASGTASSWVGAFTSTLDPSLPDPGTGGEEISGYNNVAWTNMSLANDTVSNTFASATLPESFDVVDIDNIYVRTEWFYAAASSSFSSSLTNNIPEDSSVTRLNYKVRAYASRNNSIYLSMYVVNSSSQTRANADVVVIGPLTTTATEYTGTILPYSLTTGLRAGSFSKAELTGSKLYIRAINESSTIVSPNTAVYLDYVQISATYEWPQNVGKFGGFSSGSLLTNFANAAWEIDASESYNVMNGYVITIGGKAPGPLAVGRGAFRDRNSRYWSSNYFTGTNAAYESSSAQEVWNSNVLLQVGFDSNQKMFAAWDVGPHVLTAGTVTGSTAVGKLFSYTFPQGDATWHHVCLNAPSAAPYSWVSGSTTLYAPKRADLELYFDGVKVESGSATGTQGLRNTYPAGSGSPWTSMTGTLLVNTPPDFGFYSTKQGYSATTVTPGWAGVITLGPVRTVIIDDLVLTSGSMSASQVLRNYEKGKGLIY